jgi:tetratricopeptide (TPR) repeat protein
MSGSTFDFPYTAADAAAAASLARGIDAFNRWRIDAMAHLDSAIEQDPGCVMAHCVKGLILAGGRNNRFAPAIADCLARAHAHAAAATPRERQYVAALQALADERIHDAIVVYETLLQQQPTDLLAHRLVQQELFWLGEAGWMRTIAARAMPAWSGDSTDYGGFLSVYAFSHEEAGDYASAERAGREAVERNPADYWGTHAIAHVLEMQNRHQEGVTWLEGLCDNWSEANQIVHHLWWHLCLFYLEQQQHERILQLLADRVRNPQSPLVQAIPDAYIDIQNVASLLLRLELRGVDVGERWHSVAEVAAQRIANHPSPFTSAHAAMILAACDEFEQAGQLLQSMRDYAAADRGSLATRIRVAALPAAQAAIAHRRGDYETVVQTLMPARHDLWRMGGSHAQRDVFIQILADACRHLGRRDYLAILLDENSRIGFAQVSERSFYAQLAAVT